MEDIVTFQGNIDALAGREVYGADGRKLGRVGQVFVLEGTDQPTWLTVQTGLFGTGESFVPVEGASEQGDDLVVPYEKAFVHDAPRIDDAADLTVDDEAQLYRYYGVQPPMQQQAAMARHEDVDGRDGDDDRADDSAHDRGGDGDREPDAGAHARGAPGGGPRIRRRIVTEMQTVQVPVQREEIVVEGDGLDDHRDARG